MPPLQKIDFNDEIQSFIPEFVEEGDIPQIRNFSLSISKATKSSYIRKILSEAFNES
jgi:hypothetical protein